MIGAGILLTVSILVIFSTANTPDTIIADADADADSQITIIDALGREVTLDGPAKRIAFTHYVNAEVLKAIGAWDQVVARDGYISDENFYPGLNEIPAICPARNPMDINYEKTIEVQPDVLILPNLNYHQEEIQEIVNTLEPDISVVFVDTLNPDLFCENVQNIGKITGNEEKAQEHIDFYRSIYDPIVARTSQITPENRPNVFLKAVGKTSPEQITTYGRDMPWAKKFFDAFGGRSIAENLSFAYAEIDGEWLVEQDIDVILVKCWDQEHPEAFGYAVPDPELAPEKGKEIRDGIMETDVFAQTDAVKNGKVYLFHNALDSTPRNIIGIAYMAKWLYPEMFADLDPEALHQEYLDRFIGADYNLSNAGLFVYPA